MNEDRFWQLIRDARAQADNDEYEVVNELEALLIEQTPEDILEFDRHFYGVYFASYRSDLWGAAFIMNGGCSDDGFDYFRGWLITQGRAVFEGAFQQPDSLADHVPDDAEADFGFENEDVLGVAARAWAKKTGLDQDAFYEARGEVGRYPTLEEFAWSDGQGDIDETKGKRLYPKLWAKFC
jgi:Protein of unknown function (DUF4240)